MEVQRKLASLDVILWLRENYKVGKNGSVSKNSVYQHYFDSCQEKGIEPVISATYFGKLVKRAFPGIKYNRKGPRGSAVQHYTCLKRAKIGVDVGLAGASPYPEYGTPGGGAVVAGGAFTAEELALCQYSLKRERLEHADPDSPSLDHPPGTFSPRRRQAMFPHPFAHGYPPPPSSSSSHHHYHHPPPPHPHAQHYPHHQPPQHFATEAPAHAYHHRAPPSSHARDAGLRSPTGDELSAPWTLERDHSAPPPVAMMRGSHAPPTAPAYQAQHRHQHAAVTNARSRASPHPYDLVERHHHHHHQQQQQPHLSPDPGDHPHPHTRHEYPAHHYGHPAAHLRSPSLQLGYPAHDHDNDHERDHHQQQQHQQHQHHHHHHHQHHPYYHQQHLQQRSSAPLLPSPRGHASSSGASPHPHAGYRFQAMVRGHASHASANSSPTSPSGSSHIGSSNPPSPPSPPPHLLLPSLDSATFATPLLPSSTATATASGGASIGGLRNSPTATDHHHHHHQQQHNNSNSNNRHNVAAAASTTPNADETRHDQRQQVPAATSSSSELAAPASSSSVPHAFEPSMEDMYPLPTFTSEDLERHQPQPQPQQHSHQQHQQQQSLRPPLGRSSSPALEHLLRGIASRDVEDEELVSFYDHYLKA